LGIYKVALCKKSGDFLIKSVKDTICQKSRLPEIKYMKKKNVLITDYVDAVLLKGLQVLGFTTTYAPTMQRKEMEEILFQYTGVVINTRCAIDAATMEASPSLRWIGRLGSGLDIIDLPAAKKHNVAVLSAPEGNAVAVAEHAMTMVLCLMNKMISAHLSVQRGEWLREDHRGEEVTGKTIGIIGYGNNGSAFARLWKGWDVQVLAYDKYLNNFGSEYVKEVSLETLQQEADIISLHIPLTSETEEMVNGDFLKQCKPGCLLINTSRGKNINLYDVYDALVSGKLGGACLDVFPWEPPSAGPETFRNVFDKLCQLDQVILSPHIAGWTIESKRKISEVLLKKISAIVRED
jgi:D-3-phosphoglycerate dehydrogenase